MTGRMWAYVGAVLGGAVSVAANVAHSYVPPANTPPRWTPQPGAVGGAVFWPLALFVAVEIMSRVEWPSGWRWVVLRFGGLAPVGIVAAVVSYRHLSGLLAFYGEDSLTVVIGPLVVDGLMVMATGALIATGRRDTAPRTSTADSRADQPGQASFVATSGATPPPLMVSLTEWPGALPWPTRAAVDEGQADEDDPGSDASDVATRTSRRSAATAARITKVRAEFPDASQEEVARRVGCSVRTVQRHRPPTDPATPPTNGVHRPELLPASNRSRPAIS